ncbi:hypothetical protein KJ885_04195 [Patescibacteria group bacterium]|nr:hypothetical protein [Patescibacteria group bacterium]
MFISPFKNRKLSLVRLIRYIFWVLILLALIFFSWLFLFIYKYLYFAIVQEAAIINLKSQLVITKVNKVQFDGIVKKYEEKQNPLTVINFKVLKNPFITTQDSAD